MANQTRNQQTQFSKERQPDHAAGRVRKPALEKLVGDEDTRLILKACKGKNPQEIADIFGVHPMAILMLLMTRSGSEYTMRAAAVDSLKYLCPALEKVESVGSQVTEIRVTVEDDTASVQAAPDDPEIDGDAIPVPPEDE